ncbi:MAG: mandelate racemase/muconate lactonizing enzyme family protein [Dehalococcoidia bacterium]
MKITSVTPFILHPGWRKNWIFVKVETDAGITGWGEAYTQYDRDRTTVVHIEEMGKYLVGRSPFNIRHFTQVAYDDYGQRRGSMELYCALSGIEAAMWDIVGKATGQPVYNLLGGPCRDKIRVYANGWYWGAETPDDFARMAEKTVEAGFTAMKFDAIHGPWRSYVAKDVLKHAVERIRAVRDAVGPDIDLLIELHRRLAPMRAVQLAHEIEEFAPFWFEEPCPAENLDALAEIRSQTTIPVVTGEALYTKASFMPVFEKRAADIINPDVCNVGGILELKEIAAMAEPHYVAVSPHNYNSTTLGLAATVQAAAVMPNFLITEYFVRFTEPGSRISSQLLPKNGYVQLPDAPGLGIEIYEDRLEEFAYQAYEKRNIPMFNEEGP